MTLFEQLALALGLGLLIGLQRQRATGKIAGIRTFPLITLLGVLTGRLADPFGGWIVAAGLVGVAGMILIGNLAMLRRGEIDPGITTEVAGLVMFVVGAALAAGLVAESIVTAGTVSLLLHWKKPLHRFAERIGPDDFRALIQLVLLALVILPLLPDRPYGPYGVLNPFEIWLMVVLIVGISLIAYVAYKLLDARLGTVTAGVLGGLISSTAATIGFARRGHDRSGGAEAAAVAIALASVAVFVRVLLEIAVVAPTALAATGPPLMAMMLAMLAITGGLLVVVRPLEARFEERRPPSNLGSAMPVITSCWRRPAP